MPATSVLGVYTSKSALFVAPVSLRNCSVTTEMDEAISFRSVRTRVPANVDVAV